MRHTACGKQRQRFTPCIHIGLGARQLPVASVASVASFASFAPVAKKNAVKKTLTFSGRELNDFIFAGG
jgi:hypothetical protein